MMPGNATLTPIAARAPSGFAPAGRCRYNVVHCTIGGSRDHIQREEL